jgi:preprotein translocase SecE subunit
MDNDSAPKKRARLRKAPTVRQQIQDSAEKAEIKVPKPKKRHLFRPFSLIGKMLKTILRPLAPVGRPIRKVLGWLMPRYFVNAWRELRQVTWPNRRETWRLTGAVFVFAVVFGALVAVVDKGLDEFFKKVILKQ